jgi:hypothetical protein
MNPSTFFRRVLRRWYVLVAGLILTGFLVSFVGSHISPTYTRGATQILVPGTKSYPTGDNPYLYTGNLTQAASVLVDALSAGKVDSPITSAYPGSTISVTTDASTSGPMVSIQVTAKSNADAAAVLDKIVGQIDPVLSALQQEAAVPKEALIKSIAVTADTSSQESQKSRMEGMAGAGIAGLVISILLAAGVDALVMALVGARRASALRKTATRTNGDARPDDAEASPSEEEDAGAAKKGTRRPGTAVPKPAVSAAVPLKPEPTPSPRSALSRGGRNRPKQFSAAGSRVSHTEKTTEP